MRRVESSSRESGAALPTIAIMLVVLLGMAAFAVDLGWLYLNSNRIQKTADAAALAGVVNLPGDFSQAETDAAGALSANGFGGATMVATQLSGTRLQVDLTESVDTFFMNIFGIDQVDVSRRSTAQFILPVPLGSPDNCMGRDPAGTVCADDPGFWVAISGTRTDKAHGDAYTADCIGNEEGFGPTWGCVRDSEVDRDTGYNYAIDVGPGTTGLNVMVYDAGFYERTAFSPNIPYDLQMSAGGGVHTTFEVRDQDNTPYDPNDNATLPGCSATIDAEANAGTYKDQWASICTLATPDEGIYVLNVNTSGATGGSNAFSLAATTTTGSARVYGIGDMSLYNTNLGSTATINLAEVAEEHAGKTLLVGLFDSGDADSRVSLRVVDPGGNTVACSWTVRSEFYTAGADGNSNTCDIETTTSAGTAGRKYNGQWLDIRIAIPDDYTCGSACFWQVKYDVAGGGATATDRTTWTAQVIGNPVRLVPNEP